MLLKKLLILLAFAPLGVMAQTTPLMLQGGAGNYYLNHTVGPKENYYSVGRMYNISPSLDLAPFNQLKMNDGLKIGQKIKIPLIENNFSRDAVVGSDDVLVPVQVNVSANESLASVARDYQSSEAKLARWNRLTNGKIPASGKLIVGYLKVKKDLSPLASAAVTVPSEEKQEKKIAVEKVKESMNEKELEKIEEQPIVKKEVKKEESKPISPKEEKSKEKPVAKKEKTQEPLTTEKEIPVNSAKNVNGGFFRSMYESQMKSKTAEEQSGNASLFKSSSGWTDGKYYCLFNGAAAGTVIRITNKDNNHTVYAKVLDAIPDMKQNAGIMVLLSNAAAAELGTTETNFSCSINF